ncbi:hypothetical protein [Cytobacillus dafuensis]|uniref:Uncharacterized protein n=1 Tax=Cytobacillus dafuensis TaxID=1742359 RepID=A0A5B8Z0D5_CYTDA|nr:hypothetical protein [Cytobacillus dafuensis]QED46211.1 hypothetical protein FSZ17_02335 [Cytobacillus dafuensis]
MSRIYTDYINNIALTLPDRFIDVKTGDSLLVSSKIQEQIEYHANNNTLIHLLLSALNSYFHPKGANGGTEEILFQLAEIKKMMQHGYPPINNFQGLAPLNNKQGSTNILDMKDLEDVLEVFGG